jgi:hypothetical protein
VATFAQAVAYHVLEINVLDVTIANDVGWGFAAAYGENHLTLNLGRLGHQWFETVADNPDVERLLIHEFAHHIESNHLDERYHDALCELGSKLVRLARQQPDLWR